MLLDVVLISAALLLGYSLGHSRGREVGWALSRQLPCVRHLPKQFS